MTQTLPSDVSRCHGFCCPQREWCLRYTERKNYGDRTPFSNHLCEGEGLEHYMPIKESK